MNKINKIMLHLESHKRWIKKFKYADDLYQESIYSLLKQGEEKVIRLYEDGEIDAYFAKTVKNAFYLSGSKHNYNFKDDRNIVYTNKTEERICTITPDINIKEELAKVTSYWYDKNIFELFVSLGSITKVAEETTIPYYSVKRTITKVKNRLK
jgi:hypothetical protein